MGQLHRMIRVSRQQHTDLTLGRPSISRQHAQTKSTSTLINASHSQRRDLACDRVALATQCAQRYAWQDPAGSWRSHTESDPEKSPKALAKQVS